MSILSELVDFLTSHLGRSRDRVAEAQANFNTAKAALDTALAEHEAVKTAVASVPDAAAALDPAPQADEQPTE